ncbi:P-type ATPase [Tilletia horrida]|uniref:P-type Na(+) transporter n=1 Tax=Tilletia horrida TaxID=155126 RepID=A0AAN6GNV2_9BASI|nr:P-type ATPase [Tilletia horrida]KAK0549303.1 P-type ATPase [Tilletia horrida]KAK0564129.1 P-type ATPase [Tilletia horrida]
MPAPFERSATLATQGSAATKVNPPSPPADDLGRKRGAVLPQPSREQVLTESFRYSYNQCLQALDVEDVEKGLSDAEAKRRLEQYGPNVLEGADETGWARILLNQIANAMTLILVIAMVVSFAIQSWIEGGVLAFVVFINVAVGFHQELGAEKTMNSLRNLASPTARVIRGGHGISIPAQDVVPGDIIELQTGDTVPADLRLIEAVNFEADEALLTGESVPVAKDANISFGKQEAFDVGVGDRLNLAFCSSVVSKGRATGIAVGVGMNSEIGRIAESLSGNERTSRLKQIKEKAHGKVRPHMYVQAATLTIWDQLASFLGLTKGTPLQQKLSQLAILLFLVAVVFAIVCIAANGRFQVTSKEVIIYAVATGVSMIPASLTAVLTITMAAGTRAMVKRNVIVRRMESLEALGSVTDICSDKTGTLTQGRMVLRRAWMPSHGTLVVDETNDPFNPTLGDTTLHEGEPTEIKRDVSKESGLKITEEYAAENSDFADFLNASSLCTTAVVFKDKETGEWQAHGSPTEVALATFSTRFNWSRQRWTKSANPEEKEREQKPPVWRAIQEYPFDSSVKRMSVTYEHTESNKSMAFLKGAVERVLDASTLVQLPNGKSEAMTEEFTQRVLANMDALASGGLRVLALAQRELSSDEVRRGASLDRADVEKDMCFLGLVGIYDPPRPETAGAIAACRNAGIQVRMATGDHQKTAAAIARDIGLLPRDLSHFSQRERDSLVLTASQFDRLSEDEIDALPFLPLVIARCAPSTKVRLVEALHRRGRFVAMTGDGVNDAPSLQKADCGIAMGNGSDVAKDAAELVLTDDNFKSIEAAIEEGRRISDNVSSFILHLLAQNVGQALVLLVGLAFKDASDLSVFPLSPVEILYVIMVTSAFPAMGVGAERAREGIMHRKPRSIKTGVFTVEVIVDLFVYGMLMAALCLLTFSLIVFSWGDGSLGQDCNSGLDEAASCETVFRARSATFAVMTFGSLFLAWEVLDLRRSMFRMRKTTAWYKQFFADVWSNQFLFWCIVGGALSIFPIIYIPVINDTVFLHRPISWEWAIVFISILIFIAGIELYKATKRLILRRRKETGPTVVSDQGAADDDVEKGNNNEAEKAVRI